MFFDIALPTVRQCASEDVSGGTVSIVPGFNFSLHLFRYPSNILSVWLSSQTTITFVGGPLCVERISYIMLSNGCCCCPMYSQFLR